MTRKNIFLIWLLGSMPVMLLVSCISILVWNFTYKPEPDIPWTPLNNFLGMIYMTPLGWIFSFMTFFGWASISFMVISVYMKWPKVLIGSAIATALTGAWWPVVYTTMQVK